MIKTSPKQLDKIKWLLGPPTSRTAEIVWSYLLADILCTSESRDEYLRMICGADMPVVHVHDVWLEAQPLPPRKGTAGDTEGNTVLDLAFGAVRQRGTTQSGIEFDLSLNVPWVCFAEVKILADISRGVTYDPNKKQCNCSHLF